MIDLREYVENLIKAEKRSDPFLLAPDEIPVLPEGGEAPSPRRGLIALDNDFHPDQDNTFPVPLEQARQQISRAIWEYCQIEDPGHMLLIPAPAGFGKTHLAVRTAERLAAHRRRVFYAGPRHDFFNDVQKESERPHIWYPWQPRQLGNSDKGIEETCYQKNSMDVWLARGYRSRDFCGMACGYDYANNVCPYFAQRHVKHPIVYGMHEHLWLGHLLMKECSVVIGDEYPIKESTSMKRWRVPARFVNPINSLSDWDNPMMNILLYIEKMVETTDSNPDEKAIEITAALNQRMGTGAAELLDTLNQIVIPAGVNLALPHLREPGDPDKVAEDAPFAHFFPLIALLRNELELIAAGKPHNARIIAKHGDLHLLTSRPLNEDVPKHVIWLDATANSHLYENAFGRKVEVADVEVERKGKVFQVWSRQYGKASLDPKSNSTEDGKLQAERYQVQVRQEIKSLVTEYNYRNVGIITFKDIEAVITEDITERHGHFYANRGTNLYGDVDALFVVGTPQPDILGMVEQAKMMWSERNEVFKPMWSDRAHQYPRHRYAYLKSGFWHDKDLNALLWQSRDAELIQSVNRARILIREDVDVWLLSNLPIAELAPDALVSMADIFNAPPGVNRHVWASAVEAAENLIDAKGFATAKDLAEAVKCSQPTADKYLTHFVEHLGWQEVRSVTNQRGPKPRAVAR